MCTLVLCVIIFVSRMIVAARGTMEGATTCTLLVNPTPSRPNRCGFLFGALDSATALCFCM